MKDKSLIKHLSEVSARSAYLLFGSFFVPQLNLEDLSLTWVLNKSSFLNSLLLGSWSSDSNLISFFR